ncbi:MAG: vWA domain-containing protein [Planctomycetaceae bacterium]
MFSSLGFLAPLYAAAALAVVVPVVLHLIRRTPRGRQTFSSLMFLSPSPPTVSRRSRIENWLLLILRALAVLALVAAFCRPLWRPLIPEVPAATGTSLLVLLDVSASMRREQLWDDAMKQVDEVLDSLSPDDDLTLVTFADTTTTVVSATSWRSMEPALRKAAVKEQLASLRPTWGATQLGTALLRGVELLEQSGSTGGSTVANRQRTIVVVSDLQEESGCTELQGYDWPAMLTVQFRPVAAKAIGNAGVHPVGLPELGDPSFVRVRVTNAADSTQEQFQLGWQDPFAPDSRNATTSDNGNSNSLSQPAASMTTIGELVSVYVPPGQSRVVKLDRPEADLRAGSTIVLTGDSHPSDNVCFVTWPTRQRLRVVSLGDDTIEDQRGLRFFLDPVFAATPHRIVEIIDWPIDAPTWSADPVDEVEGLRADLVIVSRALHPAQVETLSRYMTAGGRVLAVCRSVDMADSLGRLMGGTKVTLQEADVADFSLLREVDFNHPIFAALADPRFSDLSKLHFWSHRRVDETPLVGLRPLARFDDGSLALGEVPVGKGSLLMLLAGWQRDESELTGWSKFVPVMNALLAYGSDQPPTTSHYQIHDPLSLTPPRRASTPGLWKRASLAVDVASPSDSEASDNPEPPSPTAPMEAVKSQPDDAELVAINLPPGESRTTPLTPTDFQLLGLPLETPLDPHTLALTQQAREKQDLEQEQKLWRWLLLTALTLLTLETLLASRTASPSNITASGERQFPVPQSSTDDRATGRLTLDRRSPLPDP